jgi:DNA-binding LytR/AlgR family response regulator
MYAEKEVIDRVYQLAQNDIKFFPKKINNKSISLADIILIFVVGHNIILRINTKEEIVFRIPFCELIKILPGNIFFKIQRNTIINIGYVTAFTDTTVCIADQHFTISKKIQKEVIKALQMQKQILCNNY